MDAYPDPTANFDADNDIESSSNDDELEDIPQPLTNPPADHKLLTYKYDTIADVAKDLEEWGAQAGFGIRKARTNNNVKGFGYTRVDFACVRDQIRPSDTIARRSSSTAKLNCSWQATAKALREHDCKWTLEIR
ncbi:hypothetical protein MFIFM68171_06657 [Madurella fahalii]|uniref:FAR1 domain-containing protein n=1 Tax=Madurella fahalii TaxID=1157608 RepID=A0ABQ0GFB0_9PEZI